MSRIDSCFLVVSNLKSKIGLCLSRASKEARTPRTERRSATRCGKAGCRNGAVKRKPRRRRSITAPEEEYVDRRSATRGRYKHRKRRKQDVASVLDSFPFDSTKPTAADAPEGSHGESNDGVASESLLEGESIELLFIKIKIIQMIGYYLI